MLNQVRTKVLRSWVILRGLLRRHSWLVTLWLLVITNALLVYFFILQSPQPAPVVPVVAPAVTTTPSLLNGSPVSLTVATKLPIAAMIDNSVAARPAAGLSKAAVVFEFPVEGGLTRLLALWQTDENVVIGPVRSAREYVLPIVQGFHALYVHSGGSPLALQRLKQNTGLLDADEFRNGKYYARQSSSPAPHNLFSSIFQLDLLAASNDWLVWPGVTAMAAHDNAPGGGVAASQVRVSPSSLLTYQTVWKWNEGNQGYERFIGGVEAIDRTTHETIRAATVLLLETDVLPAPRPGVPDAVTVRVTGSGKALLLRNGQQYSISWSKVNADGPLQYFDKDGNAVPIAPGLLWVHFVPSLRSAEAVNPK
ncbi:MAG: DUF3048 domain-containing protein [Patescibacteria group bacterium]